MKLIKTIYPYRYQAEEILCFFKNKIFDIYWKYNKATDLFSYRETNKKLNDEIDEIFSTLKVDYVLHRDVTHNLKEEEINRLVTRKLAEAIADAVIKSDKILITSVDFYDCTKFRASIPFLTKHLEMNEESDE